MPRRVPDISKLRRLIAYEPRVQLDGIIKSVIRYWSAATGQRSKVEGRRIRPSVVMPALAPL